MLVSALLDRGIKMGKPSYKEHTAGQKPWLDKSRLLHWPVLFLYPESMATDFVEDFCEVETFSSHLDVISFLVGSFKYSHDYSCFPL